MLIFLGLVTFFIVGNLLIYKWIVSRALKKYIKPHFSDLGYGITKTHFVGLFKSGDFIRDGFQFRPFMPSGYPLQSTYIYVYLHKNTVSDCQIRVTVKIMTLFLFIKNVEYTKLMV